MSKNIIIMDSDAREGADFARGVASSSAEEWEVIIKNSNDRSTVFANIIRYLKYAFVPFLYFLRRKKYDKIIAWQQFYGLFFAFYCRLFRVKKVNQLIVMTFIYKEKKGMVGVLYRKFFDYVVHSKYIDGFTCVATIECENYSKIFKEPIERFHYIQWGLADFSLEYDCTKNLGYVFSAGRSNRDWEFLFDALGNSKFQGKMICAEGNYQGKYNNLEVLANIGDPEYYSVLAGSTCVVISIKDCTISAGQITLIQAMQFGKPVILTQSDGLTNDYVINGENGIIVSKEKEALLSAIEQIYSNKELYQKLSQNGRKLYEQKFSNYRLGEDIGRVVLATKHASDRSVKQ